MASSTRRIEFPVLLEEGIVAEVSIVERRPPYRVFPTYGRSYWGQSPKEYEAASRVYVGEKDESILENLANRTGRPVAAYRKAALSVLEAIGLGEHKISWSQKAGCSMCPCSPGFLLKTTDGKSRFRYEPEAGPCDIYITVRQGELGESIPRDVTIRF